MDGNVPDALEAILRSSFDFFLCTIGLVPDEIQCRYFKLLQRKTFCASCPALREAGAKKPRHLSPQRPLANRSREDALARTSK